MWTVLLEDENKQAIDSLNKDLTLEITSGKEFKLIQYLDPFGDTIFNHLQMDDLITDLKTIQETTSDELIEKLIALATKCRSEPHTYLAFYGD